MFKVGDYVVYKRDVCCIKEIKKTQEKEYYALNPIDDSSLKINVPVDNKYGLLRNVLSKNEANDLIKRISYISPITGNDKMLKSVYKELMNSQNLEDLIKIIKTTYLRNDERKNNGKKIAEKDDFYFNKAEKILYNELSISLNMSYDEVKKYVFNKVDELCE